MSIMRLLFGALCLYALYFIIGGLLAPVCAALHFGEQADYWYSLFSASCQQQATRSFWILGYPMAICARCTGAYLGSACTTGCWVWTQKKPSLTLFFLSLLIALGEKIVEWTLWEANNVIRFLAGGILGMALMTGLILLVTLIGRLIIHEKK